MRAGSGHGPIVARHTGVWLLPYGGLFGGHTVHGNAAEQRGYPGALEARVAVLGVDEAVALAVAADLETVKELLVQVGKALADELVG